MRRILQAVLISIAICATGRLAAIDYVISGDQALYNIDGAKTSIVMTVPFTLARVGTNWAISTTYTNTWGKETIALVGGYTYSVTTSVSGTTTGGGLVMDNPIDRLDAAGIFPRALLLSFLTSQQKLEQVTYVPVPFLRPRHAALHCYRWNILWSPEAPCLPRRIRFELDQDLVRRVSADAVSYTFRSGVRDRSLFRRFQETQRTGAEYSVVASTNWQGARLPVQAMMNFTTLDHRAGAVAIRQLLVVTVAGIAPPESDSVMPTLLPGDSVQAVLKGTCYSYTATDGKFLSPAQTKAVGQVLPPAPPLPGWGRAYYWIRSFPWQSMLLAFSFAVVLLVTGTLIWVTARYLSSRKGCPTSHRTE